MKLLKRQVLTKNDMFFFNFSKKNLMQDILFVTFNYDEKYHPKVNGDIDSFNEVFNLIDKTNYKPLPPLNSGNKKLIKQKLLKGSYKIVHFSLHGNKDSTIQITDYDKLSHDDFIELFDSKLRNKAIILNICYSDKLAEKINIKTNCWVLGWKGEVSTVIVPKITSNFYSQVLNGRNIGEVIKEIKQENLVKFEPKVKDNDPLSTPSRKILGISIILIFKISVSVSFLIVFVVGLKWLIVPDKENVNFSIISNQTLKTDSINIIYPLNGSIVDQWDTVKVTAFLQPNFKPWIFIYSNTKKGWIPQLGGNQILNNEWEFNVEFGNSINSSGETKIIACIVDSLIETRCKNWLENPNNNPLNDEIFNAYYKIFEADTITVKIK